MSSTKKLVLFDWGNVLMNAEYGDYTIQDVNNDLADAVGVSENTIRKMMQSSGFWTLSGREFNSFLAEFMPVSKTVTFRECWREFMGRLPWFDEMLETVSLISRNAGDLVDIGILSTCSELDSRLIREKVEPYVRFFFFSFSMGVKKPDSRVYPLVENVLGVQGKDILYFDDLRSSTNAALKHGWNAVCVDGRMADFVRERTESFLGRNIRDDNIYCQIATWMSGVYGHAPANKTVSQTVS